MFAGTAVLSKAVKKRGFEVEAWDKTFSQSYDVTVRANRRRLVQRIREGNVLGLWFGTECKSFSRARRAPVGSRWPAALRSREAPEGVDGLDALDHDRVAYGNALASATAELAFEVIKAGIPTVIENPVASFLWWQPCFLALRARFEPQIVSTDYCGFGKAWRKRTRLWSWHLDLRSVMRSCSSGGGCCDFSGKPHVLLTGKAADGRLNTKVAEKYPRDMVDIIAANFVGEWQNRNLEKSWRPVRPELP